MAGARIRISAALAVAAATVALILPLGSARGAAGAPAFVQQALGRAAALSDASHQRFIYEALLRHVSY
jgi:hypothetical protein